jgi:uncharacterized membrane protein YraQ (UPF0718 family)
MHMMMFGMGFGWLVPLVIVLVALTLAILAGAWLVRQLLPGGGLPGDETDVAPAEPDEARALLRRRYGG